MHSAPFTIQRDLCPQPPEWAPRLLVVIDTEEEFDWGAEFSRSNTSVRSMREIGRVQRLFDEYRITPTYVVDFPIVSQADGYRPLQEIHASGRCLIGAHLHPWVNPPFEESVNRTNSFPGNLPRALEAEKLKVLGEMISDRFGSKPIVYKAGRYGLGGHTLCTLAEQGYEFDCSVCPYLDSSHEGGPNYADWSSSPSWVGNDRQLLELPFTGGYAGHARRWGSIIHERASRPPLSHFRAVGILARLDLVDKIYLSPEGFTTDEMIKLVQALYKDGLRVFTFAFHSPSVEPGHTPYVRTGEDLNEFLARCSEFFEFFMSKMGGVATTPLQIREELVQAQKLAAPLTPTLSPSGARAR